MASLSPSERFNSLIEGLRSDVRYRLAGGWFPEALAERVPIILLWRQLRRLSRRFHAIMAKYRAGAVPEAVSATPQAAAARPVGSVRAKKLSQRSAGRSTRFPVRLGAALRDGGNARDLGDRGDGWRCAWSSAACRPMCQMLHVKPPVWLKLPRRPRKARKPRPSRAVERPPAPDFILNDPAAIIKPDGSVWKRFGCSTTWIAGCGRTFEEAQKMDPPQRIWPPRKGG